MAKKSNSKIDVVGTYNRIKASVEGAADDVLKFASGNKAAGVRVRKMGMEVKNLCAQIRKEVSALKK